MGRGPVRFGYLSSFGVILQVGHDILQHLTAGTFLHPGKLGSRIRSPFAVDDFGEHPLTKEDAIVESRLLPQVGLVGSNFVTGHDRYLTKKIPSINPSIRP